jgi:Phasin protein
MSEDNSGTESQGSEQQGGGSSRSERGENARSQQMRGENSASMDEIKTRMGEVGVRNINAGLRMQSEMFDTLQAVSRDWMARATSEVELAFNLSNRLSGVRSVPDAISTYQQWLSECLTRFGEDSRHLITDGQKIVATGVRCFTNLPSPGAMS